MALKWCGSAGMENRLSGCSVGKAFRLNTLLQIWVYFSAIFPDAMVVPLRFERRTAPYRGNSSYSAGGGGGEGEASSLKCEVSVNRHRITVEVNRLCLSLPAGDYSKEILQLQMHCKLKRVQTLTVF